MVGVGAAFDFLAGAKKQAPPWMQSRGLEWLYRLMQEGHAPIVVDVRSVSAREMDPRRIPGSIAVDIDNLDANLADLLPDRDIILYCT